VPQNGRFFLQLFSNYGNEKLLEIIMECFLIIMESYSFYSFICASKWYILFAATHFEFGNEKLLKIIMECFPIIMESYSFYSFICASKWWILFAAIHFQLWKWKAIGNYNGLLSNYNRKHMKSYSFYSFVCVSKC